MAELLVKLLLAYLLGGVMGGDVMRRLKGGEDLRAAGSGNVGATNALRTRGWKFAIGVLLIDVGKGIIAALALPLLPWPFDGAATPELRAMLPFVCGFGAALGHCYPLFQKFRGGKGVATLAGVFAVLIPAAFPWVIGAFALVVMVTGYVALASITGGVVALLMVSGFGTGFWSTAGYFSLAMLVLVLFKHRGNIQRLLAGTEPRMEKARVIGRRFDRRP